MMEQNQDWRKISCYLIGENSLLIQCSELLMEEGHQIFGIISPNPSILQWAEEKEIPSIDLKEDYVSFLKENSFDYLFSVVNLSMLPIEVLEAPRKLAINFHDSLLPKYAGINATSWAILNREKKHGVTWHVMELEADTGDILKNREVTIEDEETSYSLNLKCYEAGLDSFAEMLHELSLGQERRSKQNLADRTYFGKSLRPSTQSIFSWKNSAETFDATLRAFEFGPQANDFGIAKLAIEKDFIIVQSIEILESESDQAPGTITQLTQDALVVATISQDISIKKVLSLDGIPLSISNIIDQYKLYQGYQFSEIEEVKAQAIHKKYQSTYKYEAFWVEHIAQYTPLEIPYKKPKLFPIDCESSADLYLSIPEEVFGILQDNTLSDFLFAAFIAFLGRISGEAYFDIAVDARFLEHSDQGNSLFATSRPFRVPSLEKPQTFHEFLSNVQEQITRLEKCKTYLRDIHTRYPALLAEATSGRHFKPPIIIKRVDNFDKDYRLSAEEEFIMILAHKADSFFWIFDTNILTKENAQKLAERFDIFLKGIASTPNRKINSLPISSVEEKKMLITDWNDTKTDYPKSKCIHELFTDQARQSPESIAVIDENRQITYRELDDQSTKLASYLRSQGVQEGDFVGIFMGRSIDLMVGLLGTLKSGAAYIPLDPIYPKDRIAYMVEDSQLSILLTDSHLKNKLPEFEVPVVQLDHIWEEIKRQDMEPSPSGNPSPENLAYVIYTSGSTGTPKGVQITHRNLTNFLCSMSERPGIISKDKILALTTVCFDIAGLELYLPLLNGGQLEIPSADIIEDGFLLKEKLESGDATIIQATPATWQLLITAGWEGDSSLKILCGGEALSSDLAEKLNRRCRELWNLYGPTETTIWSSICKVKPNQKITIGRPIANTQMYILDKKLSPVLIGIPGELYIGGDGVGKGYLNRPELTKEKFIPNPIHPKASDKLYKTGDLARYLSDGNIEFLNRIDNQTKIRGFRIELGEIESILRKHPDVRDVTVIVREDEPGNKKLVAYIIPCSNKGLATPHEFRTYLQKSLPSYMHPSSFVLLEKFPITPNGKIDKNALPLSSSLRTANLESACAPPNTHTEKLIVRVWKEILGADQIGIHDNFFDAGGNSMLLTRSLSKLRKEFQREFTSVDMLKYPTVFSFAQYINQGVQPQEEAKETIRIQERTASRVLRNKRLQLKQTYRKSTD